jgi:hypothetical protein
MFHFSTSGNSGNLSSPMSSSRLHKNEKAGYEQPLSSRLAVWPPWMSEKRLFDFDLDLFFLSLFCSAQISRKRGGSPVLLGRHTATTVPEKTCGY